MEESELKNYLTAGEIWKEVAGGIQIRPDMKILDLVDSTEKKIIDRGGKLAFPVNVSINEMAAHDTAGLEENRVIGENDVVKVDIGVHINGFIADGAFTIDLSVENDKLLNAAKEALDNAISSVKDGVNTADIGRIIEDTIKKYGYKPIENLGGHSLGKYLLHSGIEIPNYASRSGAILKEGDVIAIEPFATNGLGHVVETTRTEIFSIIAEMPTRNQNARNLFKKISEGYETLPFAERWVIKNLEDKIALRELVRNESLRQYPVLKEKENGLISQFEHTVIVEKDSCKVTTE